jgi:hypothetical protein
MNNKLRDKPVYIYGSFKVATSYGCALENNAFFAGFFKFQGKRRD